MDADALYELPGGDEFEDVTALFRQGAEDMAPGNVILTHSFTLMDAMVSFEIGEPRMDSGMILEQAQRPPFDPLAPMLPEEICWILDRSFACEMDWHAGNTLSQTVYTLLYVHHLTDISPDFVHHFRFPEDPLRPQELITIVLRTSVLGLLKACDIAWRELSKARVHDTEDWQAEKCDVSLVEGVPAEHITRKLDEACAWLRSSTLSPHQRDALCGRLLMRKILLEIFRLNLSESPEQLRQLILIARTLLQKLQTHPSPTPSPDSKALLSFDPYITRRLHSFVPIRVIQLSTQEQAWQRIEQMLQGWEAIDQLLNSHSVTAWKIAGSLSVWSPTQPVQAPYIRSLTQTVFFDRNFVINEYPSVWLVDRFFLETLGYPYETISHCIRENWVGTGRLSLLEMERQLTKLMVNHVRSFWHNPPRRRRYLMRSILEWESAHDVLSGVIAQIARKHPGSFEVAVSIPQVARLWQFCIAREIILSGFQQDLYAAEEKPIAYWYTAQVIEQHLACLESFENIVPKESPARQEMAFQRDYLTALQMISIAMCLVTSKDINLSWSRISTNFKRRYKWLFIPEDAYGPEAMLLPLADLRQFAPCVSELLQDDFYSPSESLRLAADILRHLNEVPYIGGWLPVQARDRLAFVGDLAALCDRLQTVMPSSAAQLSSFDEKRLRWDPDTHPWFPDIVE